MCREVFREPYRQELARRMGLPTDTPWLRLFARADELGCKKELIEQVQRKLDGQRPCF